MEPVTSTLDLQVFLHITAYEPQIHRQHPRLRCDTLPLAVLLMEKILHDFTYQNIPKPLGTTSTPQLPFKIPQIPSDRDYKAPNGGTLGGLGMNHPHPKARSREASIKPSLGPVLGFVLFWHFCLWGTLEFHE